MCFVLQVHERQAQVRLGMKTQKQTWHIHACELVRRCRDEWTRTQTHLAHACMHACTCMHTYVRTHVCTSFPIAIPPDCAARRRTRPQPFRPKTKQQQQQQTSTRLVHSHPIRLQTDNLCLASSAEVCLLCRFVPRGGSLVQLAVKAQSVPLVYPPPPLLIKVVHSTLRMIRSGVSRVVWFWF